MRAAWLGLLHALVGAGRKQIDAAEAHAQAGRPERAAAALVRARTGRRHYERAVAAHPEWADEAPLWPEPSSKV